MFFITRQTRNEKWFLLEQPADKQGTQYRNTIEFESLIYRWVKAKINRNFGDVISTIQLKIISPFFILCNDIKDVYFSFFWIYLLLLLFNFFFAFHGILLNMNGMNEKLQISYINDQRWKYCTSYTVENWTESVTWIFVCFLPPTNWTLNSWWKL